MSYLLTKCIKPANLLEALPGVELYQLGSCSVMVGQELVDREGGTDLRWHLSIAHPSRFPTWNEIGEARDRLLPADIWLCVPHPPREFWMSLHPNCFHLWEVRDPNLVAQWQSEGIEARRIDKNAPQPEHRP